MSKVVVYVLDKFVWILLVAVITTQALQIAGVVEGPRTLGEITYEKDNELEFKVTAGNPREKRQSDERFALLDNIFNRRFEREYIIIKRLRPKVLTAKI